MIWVCQNEINSVFFPSFQVMRESRSERKGMKKAQKQVPLYRDYIGIIIGIIPVLDLIIPVVDLISWWFCLRILWFYHGNSTIFHHHLGELVQGIVHQQNPSFVARKRFFSIWREGKNRPVLTAPIVVLVFNGAKNPGCLGCIGDYST